MLGAREEKEAGETGRTSGSIPTEDARDTAGSHVGWARKLWNIVGES